MEKKLLETREELDKRFEEMKKRYLTLHPEVDSDPPEAGVKVQKAIFSDLANVALDLASEDSQQFMEQNVKNAYEATTLGKLFT